MHKFNYLTLSVVLITGSAWSMKFSAPLNRLKLPVMLSTEQPPSIKHTPQGDILMSATMTCGDPDVVEFSHHNPNFEYMPQDAQEIDVIVGYWLVEEGTNSTAHVPTENNWFPIAYKKLPINGPKEEVYEGRFLPITHTNLSSSANVMDLMKYELMNVHSLAKTSFESNKNYRVYAGAFGCKDPDGAANLIPESSAAYTYKASAVESLRSLENKLPSAVDDLFASSSDIENLLGHSRLKIDLKTAVASRNVPSANPSPYDYTFSNGSHGEKLSEKASGLYGIYKKIMDTEYPVTAADVDAYKAALASSDWKTAVSGYTQTDKIAFCNSVGATSNKNEKVYQNLEAFSMNLACKNLYNAGGLDTAYKALTTPDTKPDLVVFNSLKKALAKRFFLAASFETAQKKMNETDVVARTGCFKKPSQSYLLDRLIVSYPFIFNIESGKYVIKANQHNALHPEGLFALQDYKRYFANNESLAVWGQVVPGQDLAQVSELQNKSIILKLNDKQHLQDHRVEDGTFNNPITINFMIRALGRFENRSCIWKC